MSFSFDSKKSTIPKFYDGKTIFITGGNGFIGKVFIEKILRSCPGVEKIYMLMRPKKDKSIQERLHTMFDVPLFDKLKEERSGAIEKVVGVQGDASQLNLGLSDKDIGTLMNSVSIVYHIAASVRFDDFLRAAILINTRSTREVIGLAKQMKSLDAFIYISTAYCHADQDIIEEKIYPPKQDWREAIELAENYDEETLQVLSQKYIHPLPNTYTFTKALAERVVFDLCENQLPAIILRPSIVSPTMYEPVTGWVDNFNGPTVLQIIGAKGLLRVLLGDNEVVHDNVCVDHVAKCMLITPWKKAIERNLYSVAVYNVASDYKMPVAHFKMLGHKLADENPPDEYLMTVTGVVVVRNPTIFYFLDLILHVFPGIMMDSVLLISGNKPRILKIYRKCHIAAVALMRFMCNTFSIRTDNYMGLNKYVMSSDESEFSIHSSDSIHSKAGYQKALDMWCGVKKYLLKEKPVASEADVRKYARLKRIQNLVVLTFEVFIGFLILTKLIFPWFNSLIEEIVTDDCISK